MSMEARVGEMRFKFNTPEELQKQLETKLQETEDELKTVNEKIKVLNKQKKLLTKTISNLKSIDKPQETQPAQQ